MKRAHRSLLACRARGSRRWPPVTVESEPPGATVYRDLRELGAAPQTMAGGDPAVDVLDVEAARLPARASRAARGRDDARRAGQRRSPGRARRRHARAGARRAAERRRRASAAASAPRACWCCCPTVPRSSSAAGSTSTRPRGRPSRRASTPAAQPAMDHLARYAAPRSPRVRRRRRGGAARRAREEEVALGRVGQVVHLGRRRRASSRSSVGC